MFRLDTIRHRTFGPSATTEPFAGFLDLFVERSAPHGVAVADGPVPGNHNGYASMCLRLLTDLCAGQDPDAVVIAHALPDYDMTVSISGYLEQRLTGEPLIFAVSEQGRTTPFAALRVAATLAAQYERIAVLVVDQGTIPYPDPALSTVDSTTDHAVGLLFTRDGRTPPPLVRHLTGVGRERLTQTLTTELAHTPDATVILGPGVEQALTSPAPFTGATAVVGADAGRERAVGPTRNSPPGGGQWCTAVWSRLAGVLADPPPGPVVAVEYDPELGYLCLSIFEAIA